MNTPLISVVMPTYNHAQFLKEALDSVREQTYSNWEVLVINNYSIDNTINIVKSIDDPRIRLVNFHNHGLLAVARNEGIRLAQGEYIAFLDSDDTWYPEKLEHCLKALQAGYDAICHRYMLRYEDGTPQSINQPHPSLVRQVNYQSLLQYGTAAPPSAFMMTNAILKQAGGFTLKSAFNLSEDYELLLRIAKNNARIGFLADCLGEYRIHATNASKNVQRQMQAILAVIEYHYDLGVRKTIWKKIQYRTRCSRIISSSARAMSRNGDKRNAFYQLGRAIKKWPFNWRAYMVGLFAVVHL